MTEFTRKIVLITGAGSGTGRLLAEELAARGATIAAVDINPLGLGETADHIRLAGGTVKEYVFDTAKRLPIVGLVDEALDDWGRIDILILAAEVHPLDPILSMDEWDFHRTLDVNLAGPFFLMQRVGKVMIEQGGGIIVVAGEGGQGRHVEEGGHAEEGRHAGLPVRPARPGGEGAAYLASQAALAALTLAARDEFGIYNIQVLRFEDFRF